MSCYKYRFRQNHYCFDSKHNKTNMGIVNIKIIKDYILDKISPDNMSRLNDWICQSEANLDMLVRAEKMYHEGRGDYRPSAKEVDRAEAEVMSKIMEYENREAKIRRMSFLKYAAIGLVLLMGGAAAIWTTSRDTTPKMVSITANSTQTLTLPDGTKVWLYKDGTISYPENFEGNTREVKLSGEALFQVAKNAKKPFIVSSNHVSAKVLGTVFNFKTRCEDNTEEVTLLEGRLEVAENLGNNKVVMHPHQKVVVDKTNRTMEVSDAYPPQEAVRNNGMIPFHHMAIDDIAKVLKHLYNVNIVVDRGVDCNQTYSGSTPYHDSVEAVLRDLANAIPFKYYKSGTKIVLTE